jgi:hypothetical protein
MWIIMGIVAEREALLCGFPHLTWFYRRPVRRGARTLRKRIVIALPLQQLLLIELFEVDGIIVRPLHRPDDLVQLEMHRRRVMRLTVLEKEDHQERYDGGPCVDQELPRGAPIEQRPRRQPHRNNETSAHECGRTRGKVAGFAREA